MVQDRVLDRGDAVVEAAFMYDFELDWANKYNTRWYRSKHKKDGNYPFASYMVKKKGILEEDFKNYMLRFQQVTVSSSYIIKVYSD